MTADVRLSHAERETAAGALGEHYAQGRLDADEHAERHERIWAARTHGEIPAIFSDLPGGSPLNSADGRTSQGPVGTGWSGWTGWSGRAGGTPPWAHPGRQGPPRARSGPGPRGRGVPAPIGAIMAILVVVFVLTHLPFVLLGLAAVWILGRVMGGHGCGPGGPRRDSVGSATG